MGGDVNRRIVHTVAYPFGLAASSTGANYCRFGPDDLAMSATRGYVMPWPGSVLAITTHVDLSAGSGTVTVRAKINDAGAVVATFTAQGTDLSGTGTVQRGAKKFVAGDLVQADVTEVSSFTYSNVVGSIIVAFDWI